MKKLLLLFFSAFAFYASNAQAPAIQWQKTYGGPGDDYGYSVKPTPDGGYIIAGSSSQNGGDVSGNHGNEDFWIVKISVTGAIEWQKSLGGDEPDFALSVNPTSDGGYIVAGVTFSYNGDVSGNHGQDDCWIIKLSAAGDIEWQQLLGGSGTENAASVQQTTDGGYIIAGYSSSNDGDVSGNHGNTDYWVVRLSATGNILWQRSIGGHNAEQANSVCQTSDGGFIIAGYSYSNNGDVTENNGLNDCWIVKLTSSGTIEWQRSIGASGSDKGLCIQPTSDGGYIVGGTSNSNNGAMTGNHGAYDCWIIKLNSSGTIEWQKQFGGSGDDKTFSLQQTSDLGYIFCGITNSNDGDVTGYHGAGDLWVVKLSPSGNMQWQKNLGGSIGEYGTSISQTADNGYIICGTSGSADGDVTATNMGANIWVVKLAPDPLLGFNEITSESTVSVIPNPTTGNIQVTGADKVNIKVFNTIGQLIKQKDATNSISIAEAPTGLYFLQLTDNSGILLYQGKVFKQ